MLNMMAVGVLAEAVFHSCKKVMTLFAVLALFGAAMSLWGMYVWFFLPAFGGMGSYALAFAVASKFYPERAATAAGLLNTLPSFGVFFFQSLTGYILEFFQQPGKEGFPPEAYSAACVPFILFGLLGTVCILGMREPESV